MTLLERYTTTVVLTGYDEIREALFNPDLSRTFDRRSYQDGNIRNGIVSIQHGAVHRARRRVENTQFRPDKLRLYEQELFPPILDHLLGQLVTGDEVDLYPVAELLAAALASRRAGIDVNDRDVAELRRIVELVDAFSQGSAILDARDPDAVRALVYSTYETFERVYVRPARARRQALLDRHARGEIGDDELTQDILTVLLRHRADPALELGDDGRIVREVATYLQGGTHTSGQVAVNALDLLFATGRPELLERVARDRLYAQRVAHETLRLRPTTPRAKRRAEAETMVAGQPVPKDSLVVLDLVAGNRDPRYFGAHPDDFDPDRVVDPSVPRWGLSFGAGAHQCPGRSVGGGFPVPAHGDADADHLFGLVALMIQAFARSGSLPHPDRAPVPDTRTDRYTRWAHYWVRIGPRRA
jgi:cytochrome P450